MLVFCLSAVLLGVPKLVTSPKPLLCVLQTCLGLSSGLWSFGKQFCSLGVGELLSHSWRLEGRRLGLGSACPDLAVCLFVPGSSDQDGTRQCVGDLLHIGVTVEVEAEGHGCGCEAGDAALLCEPLLPVGGWGSSSRNGSL